MGEARRLLEEAIDTHVHGLLDVYKHDCPRSRRRERGLARPGRLDVWRVQGGAADGVAEAVSCNVEDDP